MSQARNATNPDTFPSDNSVPDMAAVESAFEASMNAEVPDGLLPPGNYLVKVMKAAPRVGQNSGKPYIALELKVQRDLNPASQTPYTYRNTTFWPILSLSQSVFPIKQLRAFAAAIGYVPQENFLFEDFRTHALDTIVRVRTKVGKDAQGDPRPEVVGYGAATDEDLLLLVDAPEIGVDEAPF